MDHILAATSQLLDSGKFWEELLRALADSYLKVKTFLK